MQALARHAGLGVGQAGCGALYHPHGIAVVQAKCRGPAQHADLASGLDVGQHPGQPTALRAVYRLTQQGAAKLEVLLDQHHVEPGLRCSQRRSQAGRTGAHHHHIGKSMLPVVTVRVGLLGGDAKTGRAAYEMFVEHPGLACRPHEGLVIKARYKNR